MRTLCLRKTAIGRRLDRVDQVGEFDRVLDEEDGNIVADQIPIAFLGIEFDRKAAHIASDIGRPLAAGDGGEAAEQGRLFTNPLEDIGARQFWNRFGQLEMAMHAIAAGVDDAFRNAFMVEVEDLLPHDLVFQHRATAGVALQAVLVVGYRNPLLGGHDIVLAGCGLAGLSALAEFQVFHGFSSLGDTYSH